MKHCSPELAAHLKQATTTVTTCWKITRTDGRVFTFTELDRDVPYQGLVYRSTGGFNKSAIKSTGTFAVDNLEVNGFLSDETIADDELRNGAFDYAEVEIFLINYMDSSMGDLKMRYGFFGEVKSAPSGMFLVELRGLVQMLATRIGETYVPECKADLGDHRCMVKLSPAEYQQSTRYKLGDRVLVATHSPADWLMPVRLPLINPGFETGELGGDGIDWSTAAMSDVIEGSINLDPRVPAGANPDDHRFYLTLRAASFRPSQAASLLAGNSTGLRLDTGQCKLRFRGFAAALELNSGASVQIIFTTATNSVISSVSHDFGVMRPERVWKEVEWETTIPENARFARVYLAGYNNDPMGFMVTCWDDISLDVVFPEAVTADPDEYIDYRAFGGVEWQVSTVKAGDDSGMSGELTKDDFIGQDLVDDLGVVWTKVSPKHMFVGEVAEDATSTSTFKTSGLDSVTAGWLDNGVIKFLSGRNVGRAVEVKSFNTATGEIVTMMPIPYQSEAGDVFQVHTGCDHLRATCHAKFDNIVNFRGEPDVPGLNQYFKVGGIL